MQLYYNLYYNFWSISKKQLQIRICYTFILT